MSLNSINGEFAEIEKLTKSLKQKIQLIDQEFKDACEERDRLKSVPIPLETLKQNYFKAVDDDALGFSKTLANRIRWGACKRHTSGTEKHPRPWRKEGEYNLVDPNFLCFMFGDQIKEGLAQMIASVDFQNLPMDDAEHKRMAS
ncbi:MAG: hypothetical protein ABL903_04220 [Methylococcales bacterium]